MNPFQQKQGFSLLVVFAFALLSLLTVVGTMSFIGNIFAILAIVLAVPYISSTIAGLISKQDEISYLILLVHWTALAFLSFIPNRSTLATEFLEFFLFILLGLGMGVISTSTCRYLRTLRQQKLEIRRKDALIVISALEVIMVSYIVYVNLETVVSYLDRHPWLGALLAAVLSILATRVLTVLGRRYGKRGKKQANA